ncbi:MAG TPA: penicillin-binding protein 2 [Candidatus Babeliales bacterium]|nr:penicillin-binding protein 2 [Candidatus Babeliales bacterium]
MNGYSKARSSFIFFVLVLMYSIILITFFGIQIIQHAFFTERAQRQYHIERIIYPPRGGILDKKDKPLALNAESTSAFILPRQIKESKALRSFLAEHYPSTIEKLNNITQHFLFIKRKLTTGEVKRIEDSKITDIKLLKERCRFYPVESMGSLVGITNIDNTGLFGIEELYNDTLAGKPTHCSMEKDARSNRFYFNKEIQKAGVQSKPVKLTIDSELQFLVDEQLNDIVTKFCAEEGGVVVLNPDNGNIEAMCHHPRFNPNDTHNLDIATTKNRTLTERCEFGSVIKIFMALAAIEEGVVTPDELINCENSKEAIISKYKVNTWKAHGIIPFSQVIEESNNIGVVKVAQRLGPKLYDHYRKVGFGFKTGINLPGEQAGFITPPNKWSRRSIISLSFGYEIAGTLLQLARAMSVFTNNGCLVTPKLIDDQPTVMSEPLYSSESVNLMREILQNTVNKGTAFRAKIKGYNVMGKTGTANLIVNGTYCATKNIYTFCGIVEKDDYKRIIITSVKNSPRHNLFAAGVAVPLFERVAEKVLIHDKIL